MVFMLDSPNLVSCDAEAFAFDDFFAKAKVGSPHADSYGSASDENFASTQLVSLFLVAVFSRFFTKFPCHQVWRVFVEALRLLFAIPPFVSRWVLRHPEFLLPCIVE